MNKNLLLFTGLGHNWLKVPLAELGALGIQDKISGFSHRDAQFAYLREGKDIRVYLDALNIEDDIERFDPLEILHWGLLNQGINLD